MSGAPYPWLAVPWREVLARKATLPHALLLRGAQGIGKRDFARALAQALLCEAPQADGGACDACISCRWFAETRESGVATHPDYRELVPEAMDAEAGERDSDKKERKPSAEIRIDDIRDLQGFITLTSHRGKGRVIVIFPAESLNTNAANALLKNLEEPPPQVQFILVSHRPHRLPATLLSRCQQIALPAPAAEDAARWLAAQGVQPQEAGLSLAQSGQAPLAALALSGKEGAHDADYWPQRKDVLDGLSAAAGGFSAIALAERVSACPPPRLLAWLQRWACDLVMAKGGYGVRYNPDYAPQLARIAGKLQPLALARYYRALTLEQRVAEHPLNARLALERLLLSYAALLGGAADFRNLDTLYDHAG